MNHKLLVNGVITVIVAAGAQYALDTSWQGALAAALISLGTLIKQSPVNK